MTNINRITFLLGLCFFFSTTSLALKCNPNEEISVESLKSVGGKVDAKKFKQSFDSLYQAQEKAISAFVKKNPKDKDARDSYFKTTAGLDTFNRLNALRVSFGYNAVSRYMFDDKELNSDVEFYTEIKVQGSKRYYINGDRVIAVTQTITPENTRIIRYDTLCKAKEVVSLKQVESQSDDLISYQVNAKSCNATAGGKNTIPDDDLTALKAFISPPENEEQKFKRNLEIQQACRLFINTSPRTTPHQGSPVSTGK